MVIFLFPHVPQTIWTHPPPLHTETHWTLPLPQLLLFLLILLQNCYRLAVTAHVPLPSKKSTCYLNWKKTAQKKVTCCPGQSATPFSAVWTARHLYQDKPESVLAALSIWTHKKCLKEVSHETIAELNTLSNENSHSHP